MPKVHFAGGIYTLDSSMSNMYVLVLSKLIRTYNNILKI
jgi:hypothetical protein